MNLLKISNELKIVTRKDLFIVIGFFIIIFIVLYYTFFTPNYYDGDRLMVIDIKHGSALSQVIDTLYAKKIIPNRLNMRIVSFIYGAEKKIKAGRYVIPNGLSYVKLVEKLAYNSLASQILVTIPEGIWQKDIAEILKRNLALDSSKVMTLSRDKSFLKSLGIENDNLEGYILPETYYFYPNSSPEEILLKMKIQMDKLFTPEVMNRMRNLKMTKNQILTLASIIDGESNYIPEFKTIAGVYYNRLRKGMPLQADPTIQYLIRDKKKSKILFKDLEINSKFNTYKFVGLPPAPINNPGKDAIMAALYPEKNDYLYFVAKGDDRHVFSKTFSEHEINVSNYRKWQRNHN
jgi:UPF0755 protein